MLLTLKGERCMKVLILMDFIREEHYSVNKAGKPTFSLFNTANGKVLKNIIEKTTGLKRTIHQKDYAVAYVYNQIPTPIRNDYGKIIKYQDVKQSEVKPFYPTLTKQIVDEGYDIIVPTGKLGVKFLLNVSSIGTVRGVPEKVTLTSEDREHSVWVLPTYSIEYTNVNKNAERQVLADFKTLGKFVREGEKVFKPSEVTYELVTTIERVREIFNKEIKNDNEDGYDITAWDLETNSLQPDREGSKPLVLSMSWSNGQGVTIPLYKADFQWANGQEDIDEIINLLKEWVASNEDIKVLHNATYDINFLMTTLGFKNFENNRDTKVGWYLAVTQEQAESLRLSDLAYEVTDQGGYDKPLEEFKLWFVNKLLRFYSDKVKEIQKVNKKTAKKEFDVKVTEYKEWLEEKLQEYTFGELGLIPEKVTITDTEGIEEVIEESPEYQSLSKEGKHYVLCTATRLINTYGSNTEVVNEIDGSKFNYDWFPLELMHPYASGDTDVCRRIYCEVVDKLNEQKRDKAFDLMNRDYPRLIRTLARIQTNGLHCDLDYMYMNDESYEKELENTVNKMREHWSVKEFEEYQYSLYEAGLEEFSKPKSERDPEIEAYRTKFKDNKWMFSPASGAHKGKVVYDILGVSVPYGKETVKDKPFNNGTKEQDLTWEDYKTDASTLKQALKNVEREEDKEIIELLLYYASLNTKRNSFTKKLPGRVNKATNKLHGGFNSTGTASGRLSSSNPNLQQLPSHTSDVTKFDYKHPVKRSFTSRFDNGVILQADYSALEMRITALYTDDREMLEMFLTGQDIHKNTASIMYNKKMEDVTAEERQASKAVAFGLIYGR